jgi:hypothetical protein
MISHLSGGKANFRHASQSGTPDAGFLFAPLVLIADEGALGFQAAVPAGAKMPHFYERQHTFLGHLAHRSLWADPARAAMIERE